MANVIEVVLKAVDQATDVIRGVADNTSSAGSKMSLSFTELNSAMQIAGQVWGAVQKVAEQTVGAAVEYNKSILDLSQSLGITTEEASRLVQVSDDFGIEQGQLEVALQMMTKNGLQPTIENVAKLADQFNATEDPVERAQQMSALLGRNWATLTPLLSAGGAAIKDMAKQVGGSLLVTEESIKKTEEYRLAVDQMNDAWSAVKMNLGEKIIPVLTSAFTALGTLATAHDTQIALLTAHAEEITTTKISYEEYVAELERATSVTGMHLDSEGYLLDAYNRRQGQIQVLSQAEFELAQLQADTVTPSIQDMAAAYADVIQHYDPLVNGFHDMQTVLPEVTDLMQGYSDKLLYNIAVQGLDADEAMNLAEQMGLVDQKTRLAYDATNLYKDMVNQGKISVGEYEVKVGLLKDALEGLDGETFTTVFQLQMEVDQGFEQMANLNKNQGAGEQEAAGGSWTIPPGAGFEGFYLGAGHWASPGETVTVTPAGGQPGGGSRGSGVVIENITIGNMMDYEEFLFQLRHDLAGMI